MKKCTTQRIIIEPGDRAEIQVNYKHVGKNEKCDGRNARGYQNLVLHGGHGGATVNVVIGGKKDKQ